MHLERLGVAGVHAHEIGVETGRVGRRSDLNRDVVVGLGLAVGVGALEVGHQRVAVRHRPRLDRLELAGALAQPLQRLVHGGVGDVGDRPRHRQGGQIARIERRHRFDGRRERERLPFVDGHVGDVGRVHRFDAALGERFFDRLGNQPVHHVVVDLVAEALLDHRGRGLAGTETGQARLARVALRDAIDLGIDEVARDLDGEGLLGVGNVYEVGFHWLRAQGSGLKQNACGESEVRKEGLEPTHPFGYQILSLARLPVPPLSRLRSVPRNRDRWKGLSHGFPGYAVFRRRAGRAGSIRGRTAASDGRLLVTISSSTGPRAVARELIIRRAGTRCTASPARRAGSLV